MTIKCLITAGCSFSQVPNADITWPFHLNERLNPEEVVYLGQGSAGNGIISRRVIYNTIKALEKYQPDEILVGIMWSGYSRREIFSLSELDCYKVLGPYEQNKNPVSVVSNDSYYIMNAYWKDSLTTNFMKYAFQYEDSMMISLEHILRTQWFLKNNNIRYFMSSYYYDSFNEHANDQVDNTLQNNQDLKFLREQIDTSYWLPITNMYDWAKNISTFDFARPPDPHPSTEQHKEMVEKVLLPFLKTKYNIE